MEFIYKYDKYTSKIDFLHDPTSIPFLKRAAVSCSGLILSIGTLLYSLGYIISEMAQYRAYYTVSYSPDFVKINDEKDKKITFGFRLDPKWKKAIDINIFDSDNQLIDKNIIKFCDENLNEIKENNSSKNNYICLIDYKITESNITNHIIKIRLINTYKNIPNHNESERLTLFTKFKEPRIRHDKIPDPFDFSEGSYES